MTQFTANRIVLVPHQIVLAMPKLLIKNATLVNRKRTYRADVLIDRDRIVKVDNDISHPTANVIEAKDYLLLPGIIDDQVHFREPGFPHKANILSEARAAVAGGVTSFMEMPNTKPQTLTQELLQAKYDIANDLVPANYSFFMGASNDNLEEVLKTDPETVCGIKIFMGSSTGDMLVDNEAILRNIFAKASLLIATHCEYEPLVRDRIQRFKEEYGNRATASMHGIIRNHEACAASSRLAIDLARETDARLHILHISTAEEVGFFDADTPLRDKRITSEACVHHLFFSDEDYALLGNRIKCNPAIKTAADRAAIRNGVNDNHIDIIATDHAPHAWDEKQQHYWSAPAGLPLVQHSIDIMMKLVQDGVFTLETMVHKMSHAVAECFQIRDRGYIEEGYKADLILYDPKLVRTISKQNILFHCGWSPLEGMQTQGGVRYTFVNGQLVYDNGFVRRIAAGERLLFDR